jgi:hypothetical protein
VNRFVVLVAAVTLPVVALAIVFALQGPKAGATSGPQAVSTLAQPRPKLHFPNGRYFGYIRSVDLEGSPRSIVFDEARFLDGEAANEASAAHGDEVPVANDIYIVNDDHTVRTLTISDDARFLLLGPDYACCKGHPSDPHELTSQQLAHAWGYWVTLRDGKVVEIEEQWHP